MTSFIFAFVIAAMAFGSGLLGLALHEWLPEKHAPERSREMIGAITGLLGLLLALVLGTLVGSAYTLYATQKTEIETLAARALQLDSALDAFGPETQPARDGLRQALTHHYNAIWGEDKSGLADVNVKSVVAGTRMLEQFLLSLQPKTDAQRQLLSTAHAAAGQIAQTEITMLLQLATGISKPMLAIVVCWALLLFCGYGLVSPHNGTVVVSMALGAIAVASAIFLIVELSHPYEGVFQVPSGAIVETMKALGP